MEEEFDYNTLNPLFKYIEHDPVTKKYNHGVISPSIYGRLVVSTMGLHLESDNEIDDFSSEEEGENLEDL